MNSARLYADFHNADVKGRVRLICNGTLRDLERLQITLHEGLVLTLWSDDADEEGRTDDLVVQGIVQYSPEEKCWVAVIDWDAIRHESELRAEAANGRNGSPATPAVSPQPAP